MVGGDPLSEDAVSEGKIFHYGLGGSEFVVFNDFTNPNSLSELVTGVPEGKVKEALADLGLPTETALLDTNVVMISTGERTILIDSGWGAQGRLQRLMQAAGYAGAEIDFVIITHTDGDHTGGLLDGEGSLAFPNAEHVMTRSGWNRWTSNAHLRQVPEDHAKFVRRLTELMKDYARLVEPGDEVVPGVRLVDAPGHRQGHVAVAVSADGEQMLHVADAVLYPIFVEHPDWHSPIDSHPAEAADTRRSLLSRAAEGNLLVASAHLPFPGLCRVRAQGRGWHWEPVE